MTVKELIQSLTDEFVGDELVVLGEPGHRVYFDTGKAWWVPGEPRAVFLEGDGES